MSAFLEAVHADHLRLGFRSANCEHCTPRWHDDARAGQLRPSIVGGVPVEPITTVHPDSALSVGHEGTPRSSVSCAQRGAALATQPA